MKRSLLLVPFLLLLAGCGRTYTLIGTVVLLDVAPHSSITEIVGRAVPDIGGSPVEHARVTLFHALTDDKPARDSRWQMAVETDENGQFHLSSYATPGKENRVGLEVSAPGLEVAFTTYVDYADPDEQYFLVVLRKAG